jgi:hypothetical protein
LNIDQVRLGWVKVRVRYRKLEGGPTGCPNRASTRHPPRREALSHRIRLKDVNPPKEKKVKGTDPTLYIRYNGMSRSPEVMTAAQWVSSLNNINKYKSINKEEKGLERDVAPDRFRLY